MDCTKCPNKNCYINNNCQPSWLEFVEKFKTRKLYAADMRIFSTGDPVNGIYVICSGKVKITMPQGDNEENIIRLAGDGQVLGHRGISESMTYPISALTHTDAELAFIQQDDFLKLLRTNSDLSYYMMMFFAEELMRSEQKIRIQSLDKGLTRVAVSLVMLIQAFGYSNTDDQVIDSPLTLKDLANFAGLSTAKLKNALSELAVQKIAIEQNNQIVIINEDKLKNLAGADPN